MQIKGALAGRPPYNKFLTVVGLLLIYSTLLTLLGGLIINSLYGINVVSQTMVITKDSDPVSINAYKLLQLIMAVGAFILPAITAAFLFSVQPADYLNMNRKVSLKNALLVITLMLVALPAINLMVELNGRMQLPDSFKSVEDWMRVKEDQAAEITAAFLADTSLGSLLANLVVLALIPAIGEELLFRGIIQRLFGELVSSRMLAIILTAVLFSALHMQFYGFFPRFLLGVVFGYLLVWSGSLWLPILAHFVNNATAVLFAWLEVRGVLPFDPDTVGTSARHSLLVITSIVLFTACLWYIRKNKVAGVNPA